MTEYRKKPVIIEAFQFGIDPIPDWFMSKISDNTVILHNLGKKYPKPGYCDIKTLEGTMRGIVGDYIIKGVNGELYPCKPDAFQNTYELVD
ncbi:hypothetical protein [Clostridium sp. Marseille-Q2269]|uniref:hypothetical protein n=1 Tax=Clostridium sp. Marseille-Q2269 TaxID=2942205 RepID=UPI002073A891|nr:hypothetical protein [Clostridium sp. Marseille-Q2269]